MEILVERDPGEATLSLLQYANEGADVEALLMAAYTQGRLEGKRLMLRDCIDTLNDIKS